jgi:AcrR family transcriptional regulator
MPPSTGLRARIRAELTVEIKEEARRQLAAEGAPGLSLRAVTRSLGMASSAIYRYFPSRDDLLTALIVDAYDAIGDAAEQADARCPSNDFGGRWMAVGQAIRAWSLANPHEYALVYGSPVPGYRAPEDTVGPASRVTLVMAGIVDNAALSGCLCDPPWSPSLAPIGSDATAAIQTLIDLAFPHASAETAVRAVAAWTQLFGIISFELFGHFHRVIDRSTPVFDRALLEMGRVVGRQAPGSAAGGREDASAGEASRAAGEASRTAEEASRAAGEASRAAGEDPDGEDEVWYLV